MAQWSNCEASLRSTGCHSEWLRLLSGGAPEPSESGEARNRGTVCPVSGWVSRELAGCNTGLPTAEMYTQVQCTYTYMYMYIPVHEK